MSDWWGIYSVDRAIMVGMDCEYYVMYSLFGVEIRGVVEMFDFFYRGNGKFFVVV